MTLLSVEELVVVYRTAQGTVPAVRGATFNLDRGETLGIAGESGCGKSTLANAMMRLLPDGTAVSGRIILAGEDVLTMKPGRLRAVRWSELAIVFQGALHALNPVRRIGWQIGEAIELHERDISASSVRARVTSLLERVGLQAHRADDYPHQLSGGQRQRVLIAMALACNPSVLIADEPTTALDVMVQAQVLQLLQDLRDQLELSMIFITHDLSLLTHVCERIAVMYAGRIVEEGPSHEVFASPVHPYTAALAAAFPTIGDHASRMAPSGLAGDPPDPADLPNGCAFAPRCPRVEDRCRTLDVQLADAGDTRRAACIHAPAASGC